MKAIALATAALMLTAGVASAEPSYKYNHHRSAAKHYSSGHHSSGRLTFFERIKIARSRARLNSLKRRVHADGHVTHRERVHVARATQRHRAMVRKERRD